MLKGLILSIEDVIVREGNVVPDMLDEIGKLIRYVLDKDIAIVILSNRSWSGDKGSLDKMLHKRWKVNLEWIVAVKDGTPLKPTAEAVEHVLVKYGWKSNEVIYIGSSDVDMRTAVNGNLLFFNALWYAENTDYGFRVKHPWEIARFIDVFCFRDDLWGYVIEDSIKYYALVPFSTYTLEDYRKYSKDARTTLKEGAGHPYFWAMLLCSAVYFSGLHNEIHYIAPYPGHEKGTSKFVLNRALDIFSKCFRIGYLQDLIIRHTTAVKSAYARTSGDTINHENQLNTIHLNRFPMRNKDSKYKASPLKKRKCVLVVDDFCTQGYSLEAARCYIENTGATAICVSLLKTINRNYEELQTPKLKPYQKNVVKKPVIVKTYDYRKYLVGYLAPVEINALLGRYLSWKW